MKLTELGYPVISDEVHKKIFGSETLSQMGLHDKYRAQHLLGKFGVSIPVDYPNNLYDGPLPLPDLKGGRLKDHFEQIATEQVGFYKGYADSYAKCRLPKVPTKGQFVYQPGWTRYEWVDGEFKTEEVPYPLEDAFTFDTETFVHEGAYPIIGTALSDKAAYIWLAKELLQPELDREQWDQFHMIPIGKKKFIAGHNISYDRIRTKEAYDLSNTEPENFFFDTLSAHIGVSGFASGQRWLYVLKNKAEDCLTDAEKNQIGLNPDWLSEGATNSLIQCYNFHVYEEKSLFNECEPLDVGDKAIRDIFVKAKEMSDFTELLEDALDYAVKDAFYTAELFQHLWPKYLDSTPSMVALCGHYHLNGSVVPLVDNWLEWIENTEKVFDEYNEEMTQLCKKLMWDVYNHWNDLVSSCDNKEEGYKAANEWVKSDPWISQLDWYVKTEKGKYAGVPNWMRDYVKDPDKKIGTKSRLAHLLLKLEWKGKPITWIEGQGWCYWDDEDD